MTQLRQAIEEKMNIHIKDISLFEAAFTHPSYANDHRAENASHYERLEFLGDAVVELAVSNYLFRKYPDYPEGKLTKMRASSVRAETLAQAMKMTGLIDFVRLGKGEEQNHARQRVSLLCDVFEALMGAIYLENGKAVIDQVLDVYLYPLINADDFSSVMDYKSYLQEELQKNGEIIIQYSIIGEKGPDHRKEFWAQVEADGQILGKGFGYSRKKAEQAAASDALKHLNL